MDTLPEFIASIVSNPIENLSIELKGWFDPSKEYGISKIVKAAIAFRNNNGGTLIVGIDKTGKIDQDNEPDNVDALFSVDCIQGIVSRYSSESFEVEIAHISTKYGRVFGMRVPSGVKIPVAAKRELSVNGKKFIKDNQVYVRSLDSNNTPSTSEARWSDWPRIIEFCFDNKEADIGVFLRRHLRSISKDNIKEIVSSIYSVADEKTDDEILRKFLENSRDRFVSIIEDRKIELPEHGYLEIGTMLVGSFDEKKPDRNFLDITLSSNPSYTGWPIWVDSRNFHDQKLRPFIFEGCWEAVLIGDKSDFWGLGIDYWRICPNGLFYALRGFEDDTTGSNNAPKPLTQIDFGITIYRVAEAIAVVYYMSKTLNPGDDSFILCCFKWHGLKNRYLSSWANPMRYLSLRRSSHQDEVEAFVKIPIDMPMSALSDYVFEVVNNLFIVFDGFPISKNVVDELVGDLIKKKR